MAHSKWVSKGTGAQADSELQLIAVNFNDFPVLLLMFRCPRRSWSWATPCTMGRLLITRPKLSGPECIMARGDFLLSPRL